MEFSGWLCAEVQVLVRTIREILGGCVEEGQFLVFVNDLFSLSRFQSG
jgi:hypothetical protein